MDEFGSSIRHSDTPTVKCAPFFYLGTNEMLTIMWPLKDLETDDEITRDYVYGIQNKEMRRSKLTPWQNDIDIDSEDLGYDDDPTIQDEPEIDYFQVTNNKIT
jgi:tubulin--tyrosine ligase-like protein 12